MIFKTREFAALINNFGPRNYLTAALINYTFKAHFQRLAADADVAEHWWWWGGLGGVVVCGGGVINALPLSVRLVATHRIASRLSSATPASGRRRRSLASKSMRFCDEQNVVSRFCSGACVNKYLMH